MTRLEQIIEEFQDMEPEFRLELLLDYAEAFPPLPERYRDEEEQKSHMVHECQTPVSLWVEVADERVHIYADVPPQSPTVRGFLAMLMEAFNGASPQAVLDAPEDVLKRTGLEQAIGMRRLFGLSVIYRRIKEVVAVNLM